MIDSPRHELAPCPVSRIQPACTVALAATNRSIGPCSCTRFTLFPVVSVQSASIDPHASFPCNRLCALPINEVLCVGNSAAARAHGHGPGFRVLAIFLSLFLEGWLQLRPVLIRAGVRRGRRQIALFHRRPWPVK